MITKLLDLNPKLFNGTTLIRPTNFVSDQEAQDVIDFVCENIKAEGVVDITSSLEYRIFNLISFLSVLGSLFVFLTSFWNEKLLQHPYRLVSTIALIDATYFLIFNTLDEVCSLKLYQIFSYTVYFSGSAQAKLDALELLLKTSLTLFKTLFTVSFFLNSFLCIDLYLTVKSPFTPASSRLKIYYAVSFIVGSVIGIFEALTFDVHGESAVYAEEITILASFIIFIIIAIPATIFASRRILRKGVSESVRKAVISRHIKYIAILVLTFALYAWKISKEDIFGQTVTNWLDQLSVYAFACQGLLLSVLRISEPLVW